MKIKAFDVRQVLASNPCNEDMKKSLKIEKSRAMLKAMVIIINSVPIPLEIKSDEDENKVFIEHMENLRVRKIMRRKWK